MHKEYFFGELIMSHVQYLYIKDCQLHLGIHSLDSVLLICMQLISKKPKWSEEVKVNITIPFLQKTA